MQLDRTQSRIRRAILAMAFASLPLLSIAPTSYAEEIADKSDAPASIDSPQPAAKIIQFSIDNGNLATRTMLQPTRYMRSIDVSDLPGSTRVDVRMRSRRDRPAMALYFRLNHTEPGEVKGDSTTTTLYSRPGYLEITQAAQIGDTVLTTTFTQMPENAASGGETGDDVVLKIRRLDTSVSRLVEESTISAGSLVELLHDHPREAAEYLAPIFRTFRQEEAIMAIDLAPAWQVLAKSIAINESMRPAVTALLSRLGAEDFRAREAAMVDLHKLGGRAALLLMHWPRRNLSPEQISKVEVFLRTFAPLSPEESASRLKDPDFLLSCIAYSQDAELRLAASKMLAPDLQQESHSAAGMNDAPARVLKVAALRKALPPPDDDPEAD